MVDLKLLNFYHAKGGDEQNDCSSTSSSSISDLSSDTSSGWEAWDEGYFDSDSSSEDDPDW